MNGRRAILRRRRLGFTLIELLVVIIIIAILVGLLIPAIAAGVRAARNASVQAEINQLAQALADFKSKMGDYPPSRILLVETGVYNTADTTAVVSGASTDITVGQLSVRTLTAFRKFWPRVPFPNPSAPTLWYDFNGDGVLGANQPLASASPWVLQGHECLVFFLGGIPLRSLAGTTTVISMTGFGKSPTNPFTHSIQPAANVNNPMYSANRNPPFFEFNTSRLVDGRAALISGSPPAYFHGMPSYLDVLGTPQTVTGNNYLAYFSTNLGAGYDPNDVNLGTDTDSNQLSPIAVDFSLTASVTSRSPSPNPYTSTPPVLGAGVTSVTYQNGQSFQIISAGLDGQYGLGGMYSPDSSGSSVPLPPENGISNSTDVGVRLLERDNLTNFHNGRLE
jgi:general secretion pathway protein G